MYNECSAYGRYFGNGFKISAAEEKIYYDMVDCFDIDRLRD